MRKRGTVERDCIVLTDGMRLCSSRVEGRELTLHGHLNLVLGIFGAELLDLVFWTYWTWARAAVREALSKGVRLGRFEVQIEDCRWSGLSGRFVEAIRLGRRCK